MLFKHNCRVEYPRSFHKVIMSGPHHHLFWCNWSEMEPDHFNWQSCLGITDLFECPSASPYLCIPFFFYSENLLWWELKERAYSEEDYFFLEERNYNANFSILWNTTAEDILRIFFSWTAPPNYEKFIIYFGVSAYLIHLLRIKFLFYLVFIACILWHIFFWYH